MSSGKRRRAQVELGSWPGLELGVAPERMLMHHTGLVANTGAMVWSALAWEVASHANEHANHLFGELVVVDAGVVVEHVFLGDERCEVVE